MPVQKSVSFRSQLQGEVADFLRDEGMACDATTDGLAELIVSLSKYREEGVPLFPTIWICDDLSKMLPLIQGQEPMPLGKGERSKGTLHQALKRCAPLAQDGWSIYVLRKNDQFEYGVFRESSHPLALAPDEGLLAPQVPIVMAMQLAENVVELRGSSGQSLHIHLSAARSNQPSPRQALAELAAAATASVDEEYRADTARFLRRTIARILQQSHGTLIVVIKSSIDPPPKLFSDRVPLTPAIDLTRCIADFKNSGAGLEEFAALNAAGALLRGMLSSDGVTIFSADAKIVAYRSFIPLPNQASNTAIGGARSRTMNALRAALGEDLLAVFYQSHDGHSEFHGVPNVQ